MRMPAARITDMHTCPLVNGIVPHVGGPILPPAMITVLVGGLPAARVTDLAFCVGPPDAIAVGSNTVLIGGLPAARILDVTIHGGMIVLGFPTVLIGDDGSAGAPGDALMSAAKNVNPLADNVNCGFIIDAVFARLTGANPNATAPAGRDGIWDEIEDRLNASITWGKSFQDAFDSVKAGGHGTMAVVGIKYSGGDAHVLVMANDRGTVGLVEGQGGGRVITDAATANSRYNGDGKSEIGYGRISRSK